MTRLARLRNLFLEASEGRLPGGDYWRDEEDLRLYDQSLGQRIMWKWLNVFEEFGRLGLPAPSGKILDFGCGAGAVGEALQRSFPGFAPSSFFVWDHSPLATHYCERKLDSLGTKAWRPDPTESWDWIFVSHVLNELNSSQREGLMHLLRQSRFVVMVEPGTKRDFQNLATLRQSLRSEFRVRAPCTHSNRCPLLESEADWCHHFAESPSEVFSDPLWSEYQRELGIDLSSLPYSYLVLSRPESTGDDNDLAVFDRQIGRARIYKGFAKILTCHATEGVRELEFQKREDGEVFKALKRDRLSRLVEWERDSQSPRRVRGIRRSR